MIKYLVILLISLLPIKVVATHIRAGEIQAIVVNCNTNTYRITITGYTDTRSTVQFGGGELDFGDGSPIVDFLEGSNLFVEKTNLGSNLAVTIFEVIHTYPSPGWYTIRFFERNRSGTVVNMSNSVNTPFYIETRFLIDPLVGCNSTPIMSMPPIDKGCVGKQFIHNAGAYVLDGDSISYEIIKNKKALKTYVDNYRFPNDPSFGGKTENGEQTATFTIDVHGNLIWDSPGKEGEYNIAFLIKKWHKLAPGLWREVAFVTRDMQVIIDSDQPCGIERPELIVDSNIMAPARNIFQFDVSVNGQEDALIIVEAAGKIFHEQEYTAVFDYDKDTRSGTFTMDLSCHNYLEKRFLLYFKATLYDGANHISSDYKTVYVHIKDPLQETATLTFVNDSPQLVWDQSLTLPYPKIQVWKYEYKFFWPFWICSHQSVRDLNFTLLKEIENDIISVEDFIPDIIQKKQTDFCYALVGIDQEDAQSILYLGCINNEPFYLVPIGKYESSIIRIFPNPITSNLNIEFPEFQNYVWIKIYDSSGKFIKEYQFNNIWEQSLPFEDMNAGLYFIHIHSPSGMVKKALFKKL